MVALGVVSPVPRAAYPSAPRWLGLIVGHRPGPGCLGEAGVQSRPDLLRGVRTATSLCPCDHHPSGGDAHEACQTHYLPPAHPPTIRPCPTCTSASTRPWTCHAPVTCGCFGDERW